MRIEDIDQRKEIFLASSPAVKQNEHSCRRARGRAHPVYQDVLGTAQRLTFVARGFEMGVRVCSSASRKGSKRSGSASDSPSCCGGSSTANPGPSVASS